MLNHNPYVFFFTTISTSKKMCFFFAWHIDASSVVWTLLDNDKLANQIARLVAIVAKYLLGKENCELWGTDDFQGQKCEHIFAPNGGYCVYYPSNIFRNARSFYSDSPQFLLRKIQPRDKFTFRLIVWERKYLMDYKPRYSGVSKQIHGPKKVSHESETQRTRLFVVDDNSFL